MKQNGEKNLNIEIINEENTTNQNANIQTPGAKAEQKFINYRELSPQNHKEKANEIFSKMDFKNFTPSSNFLSKNELIKKTSPVHESPIANYYAGMKLPESATPHMRNPISPDSFNSSNYINKESMPGQMPSNNNFFNVSPSAYFNSNQFSSEKYSPLKGNDIPLSNQYNFFGHTPEKAQEKVFMVDNQNDKELYLRTFNEDININNIEEIEDSDGESDNLRAKDSTDNDNMGVEKMIDKLNLEHKISDDMTKILKKVSSASKKGKNSDDIDNLYNKSYGHFNNKDNQDIIKTLYKDPKEDEDDELTLKFTENENIKEKGKLNYILNESPNRMNPNQNYFYSNQGGNINSGNIQNNIQKVKEIGRNIQNENNQNNTFTFPAYYKPFVPKNIMNQKGEMQRQMNPNIPQMMNNQPQKFIQMRNQNTMGYPMNINNYNNVQNYQGLNPLNYPNEFIQPSPMNQPMNQPMNNPQKPRTIGINDYITSTSNTNKKIKRIDPKAYINEDYEYLCLNIYLLAKDQLGCRFLQKKLDEEPDKATPLFYKAMLNHVHLLIKDSFGNYLIQKIITYLDEEKLLEFMNILKNDIYEIGCNIHGTRVIQHMIGYLFTKKLTDCFANLIAPNVIVLLKELNGTHIVQKFCDEFPEYNPFIMNIIIYNSEELARHRHGVCVLQKYLEISQPEIKRALIQKILTLCPKLIVDQFGNYLIQFLVQMKISEVINTIIDQMLPNIVFYSLHKYSSNVVEKCFDYANQKGIDKLMSVLNNQNILNRLILDEHGNYVMQKVLEKCTSEQQNEILSNFAFNVFPQLKNVPFGERIIHILFTNYPQLETIVYDKDPKKKTKKQMKRGKK
ncbi:MAG: hypothetical protein MJ252_03730 [archaeon]|nr:hypothetical protein [archaeon]